jgi:FKBP-type peptidyl-prolyl cis-trans isomerase FkpA
MNLRSMKLMPSKMGRVLFVVSLATMGCSSGAGAPATTTSTTSGPAPAVSASAPVAQADEVTRTTFSPQLNIRLDSMIRRPSGLYVQDLQVGNGSVATRTRTAIVRYSGFLSNGKAFDSGEISVTLGTNKTIRAWEEGLLGMRVGGRRRLVVPPSLAYGSRGNGEVIPPNAVLVFEMELTSVM